ncbi:Peptidase S8 propeptide/proteinase inhibitor I9 superfamily protein [Pleurotus pulmonarius]
MHVGHFIILFKPHVSLLEVKEYAKQVLRQGGEITHEFDFINGFSAALTDQSLQAFQSLRDTDIVDSIEPDQRVTTQG